jgi:MscS family membrane protein
MSFYNYMILNNSVISLAIVFGLIFTIALCRKMLSHYVASLLYIPINKQWKSVEKKDFIGLIIKPLGWFIAVLIAVAAFENLFFPKEWKVNIYGQGLDVVLHKVGLCLILVFFFWVALSFINFIALVLDSNAKLTKDKRDDQVIVFFRDFVKVIVWIFGILSLLKVGFNADIGSLLTGLSIVGAALALAAKESIENLIASFIIFFDKPFYTGDMVKVNSFSGTIEHIGLRSTRIRTNDQTLITVPNKQMVDGVVDNWSQRTARRAEMKIELDTSNDTKTVNLLLENIKAYLESSKPEISSYSVFITDFTKSHLTITIEYFTIPFEMEKFQAVKQEVALKLKSLLEENGMKLARAGNEINIINTDGGFSSGNSGSTII